MKDFVMNGPARHVLFFCFFLVLSTDVLAQYVSRAEAYPYTGTVSACAGTTMRIKFNNMENFSNGTQIDAVISKDNWATTTALPAVKYSFGNGGTGTYSDGPLVFSGNQNEVYMDIKFPDGLAPGSYKLKIAHPVNSNNDDFNASGGVITVTAPPSATALANGEDTYGDGYWIGHAYSWSPTGPMITTANVGNESFFDAANYLGYFTSLAPINFDNTYTVSGMPGVQGLNYQVTNICTKKTNFAIRFRRTNFASGLYEFTVNADDGIRLSVDGGSTWITDASQFVEKSYSDVPQSTSTQVCLTPSDQVVVEYFQRPADSRVTLTHLFTPVAGPALTAPADLTRCVGASASFSVSETNGSGLTNYQWKVSTDGGSTFNNVAATSPYSGVTTNTLSVSAVTLAMHDYQYKVVLNEGGACGATATSAAAVLTVNAIPTAVAADVTICSGETATLTAQGGDTYSWSSGETTDSITTGALTAHTTFTVTVTTSGCSDDETVVVTVDTCDQPEFTMQDFCQGEDSPAPQWSEAPPPGAFQFQAPAPTDGATISATTGVISDGVGGKVYAVEYIASGFTIPVVNVSVHSLPSANAGTDVRICNGKSTAIAANGGLSYTWTGGLSGASQSVSPTVTTTYVVTVTNINTCTDSDDVVVAVDPIPTVDQEDGTTCEDKVFPMSATTNANAPVYQWAAGTNGVIGDATDANTNVWHADPGAMVVNEPITFTVTVTDGVSACSNTAQAVITFQYECSPWVGLSSPDKTICVGESTSIIADTASVLPVLSLVWSNPAWNNDTNILVSPTVTTTYSCTITDIDGSEASDEIVITVNPLPTASITGDLDICEGESTALTANGGASYAWSSGASAGLITASPTTTSAYSLTATLNGCTDDATVTVTVHSAPVIVFDPMDDVCASVTTYDLARFVTPTGGAFAGSQVTGSNFQPNAAGVNTHSITYAYIDSITQCENEQTQTVQVIDLPSVSINDAAICEGDSTTLVPAGDNGAFAWSTGETVGILTANPAQTTTYTVTVTVGEASDNCSALDLAVVTVVPLPVVDIEISDPGCAPHQVQFTNTSTAVPGATYAWDFGDPGFTGNTSAAASPAHVYNEAGTYSVSLTATNLPNCAVTVLFPDIVEIYEVPEASFTFSPLAPSTFKPDVRFRNLSSGATSYTWFFADTGSTDLTSNEKDPLHIFSSHGDYPVNLVVTSGNCDDDTTIIVHVKADHTFYAPNSFSPNNDGTNDQFGAKGVGIDERTYRFLVYSRWGEVLFEGSAVDQHWDGKKQGTSEECPTGQYVWQVMFSDYGGTYHTTIGNVFLVR